MQHASYYRTQIYMKNIALVFIYHFTVVQIGIRGTIVQK